MQPDKANAPADRQAGPVKRRNRFYSWGGCLIVLAMALWLPATFEAVRWLLRFVCWATGEKEAASAISARLSLPSVAVLLVMGGVFWVYGRKLIDQQADQMAGEKQGRPTGER